MSVEEGVFNRALKITLGFEGGYADVKDDKGGHTNFGVTQETFDRYRALAEMPPKPVKDITPLEVWRTYFLLYWAPMRCRLMDERLAIAMFDTGVLHGVGYALQRLHVVMGFPPSAKWTGPLAAALREAIGVEEILEGFLQARDDRYEAIVARDPSQAKFYRGWEARLDRLCDLLSVPRTEDPPAIGRPC